MDVTVREAEPGDLAVLVELRLAFLAEHRGVAADQLPAGFAATRPRSGHHWRGRSRRLLLPRASYVPHAEGSSSLDRNGTGTWVKLQLRPAGTAASPLGRAPEAPGPGRGQQHRL